MFVKIVNYKIWSSYYDKQFFYDRLVWNCLRYHVECIENAQHMWPPIDKEKLKRRSCYDGNNVSRGMTHTPLRSRLHNYDLIMRPVAD